MAGTPTSVKPLSKRVLALTSEIILGTYSYYLKFLNPLCCSSIYNKYSIYVSSSNYNKYSIYGSSIYDKYSQCALLVCLEVPPIVFKRNCVQYDNIKKQKVLIITYTALMRNLCSEAPQTRVIKHDVIKRDAQKSLSHTIIYFVYYICSIYLSANKSII